jgi:hypothetical protein
MTNRRISALVIAASLFLGGASAFARGGSGGGIIFDVNLFYESAKYETTNTGGSASTDSDTTTAIYDIKLGYLSSSGLYLGGIYTSRSNSVLNQSGTNGSAMGGSVGYMGDAGIFIQGHYLTGATYGVYSDGSGLQVDVGYKAGVGTGWLLGAELSHRSIDYKKSSSNASLASYKVTETFPMVSIGYMF